MVFNKFGFIISFICFLMLTTISMGFDLYSHGVIFYFYEYVINPADSLFGEITLPRYLLLSYIFEFTRRLGIPLGIIVLILTIYPAYNIASRISGNGKKSINLVDLSIVAGVLLLTFFYSGLSLMLLWLMGLIVTRKKIFLLGAFFHPVGFVLMTIFIIITRIYLLRYLVVLFIFFGTLYFFTVQNYFTSSKYVSVRMDLSLNLTDLIVVGEKVFQSKFNEILGLIIIIILFLVARSKLEFLINGFKGVHIDKRYVFMMFFILIFSLNFVFLIKDRHNLLMDILRFNISDPIYATWFDWGGRDLNDSFQSLYNKRYDDSKNFLD